MIGQKKKKKKPAPPSQPIRCKAKTNHDLVARIFPRFTSSCLKHFTGRQSEFLLAPCNVILYPDRPL